MLAVRGVGRALLGPRGAGAGVVGRARERGIVRWWSGDAGTPAAGSASGATATSALRERLREDLKAAMRAKEKERTTVIRGALSAITYADKATGVAVDDEKARAELRRIAKKHDESILQFTQAGRTDLADHERAQLAILQTYLPQALPEAQLRAAVDAAIAATGARTAADLGAVMKEVGKTLSADQAPRKQLADIVKAQLASKQAS